MNWQEALKCMKEGYAVRRENWSGSKFIIYIPEQTVKIYGMNIADTLKKYAEKDSNYLFILTAHILIHTKDGKFGYYATTQCDVLAEDWECPEKYGIHSYR